jgi:hypothetical protein
MGSHGFLDSLDPVVVQGVHPNDDFRLNELILKLATLCYFGTIAQLIQNLFTKNHTQAG